MFGYIVTGRINIRVHMDDAGEIWLGVDKTKIRFQGLTLILLVAFSGKGFF
jgi:hypothetical protein